MSQTTQDYPQDADAFKRIVSDYQATAAY